MVHGAEGRHPHQDRVLPRVVVLFMKERTVGACKAGGNVCGALGDIPPTLGMRNIHNIEMFIPEECLAFVYVISGGTLGQAIATCSHYASTRSPGAALAHLG